LHLRLAPKIDDLEEDAMTARRMAVALGVIVLATAGLGRADDDKAVPRGGGGGGSHSSGAADRHPSGGGASSYSGPSHGSSGGSSEGYSGARSLGRSGAELRHPRPGTGTGGRGAYYYGSPYYRGYNRYGYGYGYYPYDRFYGGFYYGYSPYYYSGYYGYSPYYYGSRGGYGYGYRTGSLRLLVEPRESRVYVDGYYAGIVDDFDGLFQRLNISPGRHEIMFKLEGFRSNKVRVYVPLDQTVKIHHRMAAGAGTEVDETTVGVPMDDERYADRDEGRYDGRDEGRYEGRDDRRPSRERDDPYGAGERGDMGSLRLDVEPADASVYVDGDFKGTSRQIRALSLPAGRHRVEVVRPGFRTVERDVEIRPGQTTDLEVDLDR
jgi:hypothetical protein